MKFWKKSNKKFWSAGRQISFELPSNWQSAPEDNGMIYWTEEHESAAVRLSVLTGDMPPSASLGDPPLFGMSDKAATEIEQLEPLHWFCQETSIAEEDGIQYPFHTYWHLYRMGHGFCVAIFTSADFPIEVEQMIGRQIRSAKLEG